MLETKIGEINLKNPLISASGTYGYGEEYERFYDPSILGALASKGLTFIPKPGNTGTRIWETPSGMMNSIGLENPGVAHFCQEEFPKMKKYGNPILANLGGNSLEDYLKGVDLLNDIDVDFIELNISCPNVKEGGLAFGLTCQSAGDVTGEVVKRSNHPVIVKLSPNGEAVGDLAKSVEAQGAYGVSLINTVQAMAIDVDRRRPVFDNLYAGLSGPAVFPLALRMVHQVAKAVDIPVIGLGGIQDYKDVLAMLMAGASAVQVGTMNFHDPYLMPKILKDLEDYCQDQGIKQLSEIQGII